MSDGIGLAEKRLGLPGLRVLDVEEGVGKVVVRVGSTQTKTWCRSCRHRAEPQDYRLRVLPYAGGVNWPTTSQAPKLSRTRTH